jgi:hypothetical protein
MDSAPEVGAERISRTEVKVNRENAEGLGFESGHDFSRGVNDCKHCELEPLQTAGSATMEVFAASSVSAHMSPAEILRTNLWLLLLTAITN